MRHLADLRIATRLFFLGALTLVAVACITVIGMVQLRTALYQQHESSLRDVVQSAVGVVEHFHGEQQAGRLTEAEAQAEAIATIKGLRFGEDGYIWINDMAPRMVMHPTKPELDGTDLSGLKDPDGNAVFRLFVDVVKADGAGVVEYQWPKPGEEAPQPKISYVAGFDRWGWVIGSGVYVDSVQAQVIRAGTGNAVVAAALLALILLASKLVSRSIVVPLRRATDVLKQGNLRTRLDVGTGRTELNALAKALNSMMDNVATVVDDVAKATRGLKKSATGLSATSASIRDTARRSEALTEESTKSSREVSSSIDTLANGFHELEGSIDLIGQNAREAAEVAARAVDAARTTTQAVSDLGTSSAEIGVVIKTITSIAEQTNLLALNATIEAARAGEAGRGFAVVANEVKDLARETAEATDDIARRVQAIQSATQESASAIGDIAEIITRINQHQSGIAHAVAEQTSTSSQMSHAVTAAARASAAVADTLDGVLSSAQETTRGVDDVGTTAESLADVVARLSHTADAFER